MGLSVGSGSGCSFELLRNSVSSDRVSVGAGLLDIPASPLPPSLLPHTEYRLCLFFLAGQIESLSLEPSGKPDKQRANLLITKELQPRVKSAEVPSLTGLLQDSDTCTDAQ